MIDDLLEQANSSMDRMAFARSPRDKPRPLIDYEKSQEIIRRTDNQMRKPQQQFAELIDNSYNPFVPLITKKFHTTEALPADIMKIQAEYKANPELYRKINIKDAKKPTVSTHHPYEKELSELK